MVAALPRTSLSDIIAVLPCAVPSLDGPSLKRFLCILPPIAAMDSGIPVIIHASLHGRLANHHGSLDGFVQNNPTGPPGTLNQIVARL